MRIKWDYFNKSVSPKAKQLEGTTGTKGVDRNGAAHATIIGQVFGVKHPRA